MSEKSSKFARKFVSKKKISHEFAQAFAETEFEKYRVVQDQLYQSDFDKFTLPTLPFDGAED